MEYGKLVKRHDLEELENDSLASYAVKSVDSRGRQHKEKEHPYRTRFQRDRDRVIHSSAFRRLEYKTQVFVYHEGDYYRTRLTHSMEVAQIARSICKSMQLNEDLAESIALSHDLGHPPFGHTGQKILNGLLKNHGGFEHNKQGLRVVRLLEKRYPEFSGLNLTWELQEGISKHSTDTENPIMRVKGYNFPSLEAQVVDCADGIAYNAHDLDDGITSELLNLEQVRKLALWRENEKGLDLKYKNLDFKLKKYQVVRQIINDLISDFRKTTLKNLKASKIQSVDDVRCAKKRMAGFSALMSKKNGELKKFLHKNLYSHRKVKRMEFKSEMCLTGLFNAFTANSALLPESVQRDGDNDSLQRRICDYISGMTDRYAISEYKKLYSPGEND
jgi:dGTPase